MKQLLFTFMLFVTVLSPLAAVCQALPDNPAPKVQAQPPLAAPAVPAPDPGWARIEQLPHGEPIVVTSDYGPPIHCRFAGATDAYLFCDPPDSPADSGYRLDRDKVVSVEEDRWQPQSGADEHHGHPVLLTVMAISGTFVGVLASRGPGGGPGVGFGVGAATAGIVGLVGMASSAMTGGLNAAGQGLRAHHGRHRVLFRAHASSLLPVRR